MVWKIFIKLTTYYTMKAMEMDAEAHSWITDWGPLVNTFVYLLQWPGSRLIILLYGEPYLVFLRATSVRGMVFFFDSLIGLNYWTIVFIIMFIYAIWDIASFYGHRKMKMLGRQVIRKLIWNFHKKKVMKREGKVRRQGKADFIRKMSSIY